MKEGLTRRIAYEIIAILMILLLFCLITRLWLLVFLVIPCILIAALRMLYLSAKKKTEDSIPPPITPEPLRPETEQDILRVAYGVLQRRITENVTSRYPSARWVWGEPNTMERLLDNLPVTIMLNRAGGYVRAEVQIHNLQFRGLVYKTIESVLPDEPPPEFDADGDTGLEDIPEVESSIDYTLIAYQWTEANLLGLNVQCNDAIAEEQTTMLISASNLPHSDSWQSVCEELMHNGFSEAFITEAGISITLPK
jgi:hypothetical protein